MAPAPDLLFLSVAGSLAIFACCQVPNLISELIATFAVNRAPFWLLLAALASGQLLFNRRLSAALAMVSARGRGGCPGFRLHRGTQDAFQSGGCCTCPGRFGVVALAAVAMGLCRCWRFWQ